MYSNYKSVQLLIALLKKYNIRNVILSPGGSDIPIIHSLEMDEYFTCYSVVDERSAVYFGIGIAQAKNEPVACVCTSGTAVSNYLPGMTEAFYQSVPIIAITADKSPYFTGQIETQKIEQFNIFGSVSKKSVELPQCNTPDEIWYCERLIKEALIASFHHGKGPVHINIPIAGSYNEYNIKELPNVRAVDIINCEVFNDAGKEFIEILSNAKKILIVVGQNIIFSEEDIYDIEQFYAKYNCCISVEHLSNLKCDGCVFTYPVTETGNTQDILIPDLVISLGNNVASYGLKPFLRKNNIKFNHWAIDEGGRFRDVFTGLSAIFECSPAYFFKYFVNHAPVDIKNNKLYYEAWQTKISGIVIQEFDFSNFYVAQRLVKIIPDNSVLHLAILNSTRIMQFFELNKNVRVFSNVGALGIDGCLSTYMGQAASTNELAFCVIGDLSFFYDMNAAGIRHLGKNVRIILLNNGGGAEFQFFMDKKVLPTLDNFICAEHRKIAKGWIESLGFDYYSAKNKVELDSIFETFINESDSPKFVEVFTSMENDSNISKEFYKKNGPQRSLIDKTKGAVRKVVNMITNGSH